MSFLSAVAVVSFLSLFGQAQTESPTSNQTSPAQQDAAPTNLGDVEVTARRLETQVQSFINDVAAPAKGRGLARWDRSICVGVTNLDGRYAQFMIDRVAQTASAVGLDIGAPGCRPDIMIIATSNGRELATKLVDDNPSGFRPSRSNTDLGSAALERFKSSDAAVRWWHVSLPVSVDTGDIAVRLDGEEAPNIAVRDASRLRSNVRDDLARVMIILDVSKIGSVGFGALSDYVAMVALAQIELGSDATQYDSVLNLFGPGEKPTGLTQWDRDYLASLYAARRDRARPDQQSRDIIRGMVGERSVRLRAHDPHP
ncbi:hypothetical protein [Brevundimonas sp. SORGH_AS_0993]|uniref:hypothetical protein n=1 Tax=Brevundimonas sp. SORGH_AS_0993 TaxID=3041794 RepID=UPI00278298F6|nr:hypothetical protein [Brevundimonas sp. SORGH_AS_0993]MDQ1153281.1 hypothetical protein [Brevundimonas sp. SORGH_AS_0993]